MTRNGTQLQALHDILLPLRLLGERRSLAVAMRLLLIVTCGCCFFSTNAVAQEVSSKKIEESSKKIEEIVGNLRAASIEYKKEPTLENRIRVATWKVMLGEIGVEAGDDLSLWSVSLDEFDKGRGMLSEIEDQIAKAPELERRISKVPMIAMRLDAARVRKAAIEGRQELARKAERARLNQLRSIAKSYRDLLQKMSQADIYIRLEDHQQTRQANMAVLAAASNIYDIASSRKDYYLFDDEPDADGDMDFKIVQASPKPLDVDIIAHTKAMYALATCRLAMTNDPVDRKLLKESRQWAHAAISKERVGELEIPTGHAPDNPIAHYVLGLVNETFGTEITRLKPASSDAHGEARPYFTKAIAHFSKATSAISEKHAGDSALAKLSSEIVGRLGKLKGPEPYLSIASKHTTEGHPAEAWKILRGAVLRHRNTSVWIAFVDAGRRAGILHETQIGLIARGVQGGVLTDKDVLSQISMTAALAEAVWNEIGRQGAANIPADRRGQHLLRLKEQAAKLRSSLSSTDDEVTRARGQAHLALTIAYQSVLSPSAAEGQDSLREAHRLARDAMFVLEPDVVEQKDPLKQINLREALIASRLAFGHVAIQVLPKHRDDAMLAFAAAFDETAKLPFRRGNVKILGSPMITAMAGRAGDSGTKLAFEERRYRELVTRFLEGMYTLQFGNPEAAADQMATALRMAQQSRGDPGKTGPRDAAVMLGQTDGFDAKVTLHDTVRAFKILADVKAGRHEIALVDSVRLLVPGAAVSTVADIDQTLLTKAVETIQSPLVGYALASALEANVNAAGLDGNARQDLLVSQASAALERVGKQLQSRRMQNRYPHLVAVVRDGRRRFGSEEEFHQNSRKLRSRGDLVGAVEAVTAGLRRHPRSKPLWQLYLETQIEQARRGGASDESYRKLLAQVKRASEREMLSSYLASYYSAVLYELLGRVDDSLGAYEDALANASQPQDRVRARSKVSELRVRLATAVN